MRPEPRLVGGAGSLGFLRCFSQHFLRFSIDFVGIWINLGIWMFQRFWRVFFVFWMDLGGFSKALESFGV